MELVSCSDPALVSLHSTSVPKARKQQKRENKYKWREMGAGRGSSKGRHQRRVRDLQESKQIHSQRGIAHRELRISDPALIKGL